MDGVLAFNMMSFPVFASLTDDFVLRSKAIRLREAEKKQEKKTIRVNGTVVDGKLMFSTTDFDGRIKVNGNEIITPNERIVVEIN